MIEYCTSEKVLWMGDSIRQEVISCSITGITLLCLLFMIFGCVIFYFVNINKFRGGYL